MISERSSILRQAEEIMKDVVMPLVEVAVEEGNRPFAAALINPQGDIFVEYNRTGNGDPTAHAETLLIGKVCKQKENPLLKEHTMLTNAEPCSQCMTAIMRSQMERVVFGTSIEQDAAIPITSHQMKELAHSTIDIVSGVLADETEQQLKRLKKPDPWIQIRSPLTSSVGNKITAYKNRTGLILVENAHTSSWYKGEEINDFGQGNYTNGIDALMNAHSAALPQQIGISKPRIVPSNH